MAKHRANLGIVQGPVNDLSSAYAPLPSRSVAEKMPAASESVAEVAQFPSLNQAPKPVMVSKSYRIPLEMSEKIAKVCKKNNIREESRLVRDFIAAGLERIEAGSK